MFCKVCIVVANNNVDDCDWGGDEEEVRLVRYIVVVVVVVVVEYCNVCYYCNAVCIACIRLGSIYCKWRSVGSAWDVKASNVYVASRIINVFVSFYFTMALFTILAFISLFVMVSLIFILFLLLLLLLLLLLFCNYCFDLF